ncbi:MAG: TonB-dependent receptor [Gammaproteobacteria bacterium]|nr:TonB-dependent receptor [Gammaproteobacteria bacterium]
MSRLHRHQGTGRRKSNGSARYLLAMSAAIAGSPAVQAQAAASGAQATGNSDSRIEEIVVTAQFRAQNLQRTPLAITAVSSEMMDARSQDNIGDVAARAPGVTFAPAGGGLGGSEAVAVNIRGVGQQDFNLALEPGVALYIDDVYYGTAYGSMLDLVDVNRVEILRGPQGTLAGKNSLRGAIKLYSQLPDGNGGGYVQATVGNFGRREVKAATEFTLVPDTLFVRLGGIAQQQDGYVTRYDYQCHTGNAPAAFVLGPQPADRFVPGSQVAGGNGGCVLGKEGGRDVLALRGLISFQPNERVSDTLILDYYDNDAEGVPTVLREQGATIPWFGNGGSVAANFVTPPGSYYNYSTYAGLTGTPWQYQNPAAQSVRQWGISNILDIELTDALSLKSISSVRDLTFQSVADGDASPLSILMNLWNVDYRQYTQELRLNGSFGSRLDWTVGGFYFRSSSTQGGRISLDGVPHGGVPGIFGPGVDTFDFLFAEPIEVRNKSVFAHIELHATDELTLTGGVRYTDDSKEFAYGRSLPPGYPGFPSTDGSVLATDNLNSSFQGDRWDWRFTASYQFTDNVNVYGQVSTGFKGGGVNPRPYTAAQALNGEFTPETVTSYELGLKSDLFDRRMRLNAAAYFNRQKNIVQTLFNCPGIDPVAPFPCAAPANVGSADIKGGEIEVELHPVDGMLIDGSLSYVDFQYQDIDPATFLRLSDKPPYTPEWKLALGAQYEFELAGMGTLTPRVDYQYQSHQYSIAKNEQTSKIPAYGLLNFRLTYRDPTDLWEAALSVTNVTDKYYPLTINDQTLANQNQLYDFLTWSPAPPRQWAITIKRIF